MAAQKGKDLLLKMETAPGTYVTVAGLRTRQMRFNAETVDITHSESNGRWRELLAGAGIKRASVTGAGLFKNEAYDALMRQCFFDGILKNCQLAIPSFGVIEGLFQITSLEFSGAHDREVTFDITLESAGNLNFTTA